MSKATYADVVRYPTAIVILHWLIAILIIAMIPMGKVLAGLDPQPGKLALMQLHSVTGIVILLFSVIRLIVHVKGPCPADDSDWPGWMCFSSKFIHWAMIVVSLLVLVSGVTSFAGYGFLDLVKSGQWSPWPNTKTIPPLGGHRLMVQLLIGLAALHALAALYHQFLRKDRLFARMWFGPRTA